MKAVLVRSGLGGAGPLVLSLALAVLTGGASAPARSPAEIRVPAGSYYVGNATGQRDYRALANATTPGFLVLRGEVTQALYKAAVAWGRQHGYVFEDGCKTCDPSRDDQPAINVSWRDAALTANALSEQRGLDAVYRDAAGHPIRDAAAIDHAVVEPSLAGYRIPTIPELQIALRGADRAMADGTYGTPERSPNALGLVDTAGPFAEWTASSMDLGDANKTFFFCNDTFDGVRRLSNCDLRSSGSSAHFVGFRLVRKASP